MLRAVVVVAALAVPTAAYAGPFGGFAGGKYLVDGERACAPVTGERANPRCDKLTADQIARLGAKKPRPERGSSARVSATSRGTTISVSDANGKAVFRWDAGSPVGRVIAVYLSPDQRVAVIEYETRFGGRTAIEAVGVPLPSSGASRPDPGPGPAVKPTPGPAPVPSNGPDLDDATKKTIEVALGKARKSLERRRHAAAIGGATEVLGLWSDHGEALYILAAARLGAKDKAAALEALEKLATSSDPRAPVYRVRARRDKVFASLRADARFRKAVGITRDPSRPLTAYERVMGFGGKWEQRLIACEQPEMKLNLREGDSPKFVLKIKGRCGGPAETTFLDGTWSTSGTDTLSLSFPNPGGKDEVMACRIEVCRDSSGEDCVRCGTGEDEFLLRVVRR